MEKTTVNVRIELIQTELLIVDEYQRLEISFPKIQKIIAHYDPANVGVIKVSYREGKYYVVDGQHRVLACKSLKIPAMFAEVITGLSKEQEAKKFLELNGAGGETKRLTMFDVFNAKLVAQDKVWVSVNEIVESNGFKVGYTGVTSVKSLIKLHEKYGALILDRGFKVIRKAWNGDKASTNNNIICGVIEFIAMYENNPAYSDSTLARQLSKTTPKELVKAIKFDESTRVTKVKQMNAILKTYNYELRKHTLDNIHFNAR